MRAKSSETVGSTIVLICGVVIISCLALFGVTIYNRMTQEPPVAEHVYYIKYGSVLCGQIEYLPCGVRLSKCGDEYVYECMTDVRRKESR